MSKMISIEEAQKLILTGVPLSIAADEAVLQQLPAGQWVGGTIPYFMGEQGGLFTQKQVFVTEMPSFIKSFTIKEYTSANLANFTKDYFKNGFSMVIVPGLTPIHAEFAKNCLSFPEIFASPLAGWISGFNLAQATPQGAKVVFGPRKTLHNDRAVIMHVELPEEKVAKLEIINIFGPGDGDIFEFPQTSFEVQDCKVNGKSMLLADYIEKNKVDVRFPLVADFSGAKINVSFQAVDAAKKTVQLYAPVFPGVRYKLANSLSDYEKEFIGQQSLDGGGSVFSCNCILNYLYANLEGKKVGAVGPTTFGEIAYMLLNQTTVHLKIKDV